MIDPLLLEKLWPEAAIEPAYIAAMRQTCLGAIEAGMAQPGALADLAILFCEQNGGNRQQASPLLTAWTLLRYAGRLLDDVEDGAAAAHAGGAALNLSTGLIFSAALALQELESYGVDPVAATDIRRTFFAVLLQICGGQHLDLTLPAPDLDACWRIAEAKSGFFVGLICWAAARLGCDDPQLLERYRRFGINVGVMEQIRDDLSDLWDSGQQVSDLKQPHNKGLPLAYALSVLPPHAQEALRATLRRAQDDAGAEERARRLIIESGAGVYLAVQSSLYYQRSLELVRQMGLGDTARSRLVKLLDAARVDA